MAREFRMPKLGLTMEEGTIVEWLVARGERVEIGDPVLSIETDKVETEVEASAPGWLHQVGDVGSTHACGSIIGWLADSADETPGHSGISGTMGSAQPELALTDTISSVLIASTNPVIDGGRIRSSPNARRLAGELRVDIRTLTGSGPMGRIIGADVLEAPPSAASSRAPDRATPLVEAVSARATGAARILADLLGVDLAHVAPDPIEQRVTREGVAAHVRRLLASIEAAPRPSGPSDTSAPLPPTEAPAAVRRLTGMRGTIAKRMHASLTEMAQLTLTMHADVAAVLAHRSAWREREPRSTPGITDYVIAAVGRALRQHPAMNATVTQDGIVQLADVHVGLAVALRDGLLVPVIRHADRAGLVAISAESRRLAAAARQAALGPDDMAGGTFSVSTLGAFGVDSFTPIINPPNVGILGVGRVRHDIVLDGDRVTTAAGMTLSLTWDHRALDGVPAAAFCRSIVEGLAAPADLVYPRSAR
ncbi:MAG: dihydrolipoamide acetyltransferase family protein [Ilumatobacteraceae bacterium]